MRHSINQNTYAHRCYERCLPWLQADLHLSVDEQALLNFITYRCDHDRFTFDANARRLAVDLDTTRGRVLRALSSLVNRGFIVQEDGLSRFDVDHMIYCVIMAGAPYADIYVPHDEYGSGADRPNSSWDGGQA